MELCWNISFYAFSQFQFKNIPPLSSLPHNYCCEPFNIHYSISLTPQVCASLSCYSLAFINVLLTIHNTSLSTISMLSCERGREVDMITVADISPSVLILILFAGGFLYYLIICLSVSSCYSYSKTIL